MIASVWSSYFYEMQPEQMVDAFTGKGWFFSELSDEHAAVLLGRGQPEKIGRQFRRYAADRGLSFPQGHLWLHSDIAGANQAATLDNLKKWIDLFQAVGVKAAVLHPGGQEMMAAGCAKEAILDAQVKALRLLADYAAGSDLVLCLENLFTHAAACDDLLRLIGAAGGRNLGICLDTGHLNLAGRDQAGFIRQAGSRLLALHIADNEGQRDQHLMPFGPGKIDWEPVVPALNDIGYAGLFNLEIPGERIGPLPVLLAKLDYIRSVTDYLLR